MFKGLKQRLDQFAINLACRTLPPPRPRPNQIEEAREILGAPDFLRSPEVAAQLQFGDEHQFTFPSAVALPWKAVNVVNGALYRASGDWRRKPIVLLVHGWNAELQYRHELPLIARWLARRGVNGAALQLPFHGPRKPREPGSIRNFISDDIPMMLRATGQALADLHSFLLWAKNEGCSGTALWGFSFGAWLAGLHACTSDLQDCAVLTTPVSDMEEAISTLPFCEPIRQALRGATLDFSKLNLTSHSPKIAPERVLIVQSDYDIFVSGQSLDRLRSAWRGVQLWNVPHSHISVLLSWATLRRTGRWCVDQLS